MLAALHGAREGRGYNTKICKVGERDVLYRIWPVLAFEFTLYSSQEDTLGSFLRTARLPQCDALYRTLLRSPKTSRLSTS